jgi:TPR repeat protein
MAPLLLRIVHVLVVAQTFGQLHAAEATAFDWFRETTVQGLAVAESYLDMYNTESYRKDAEKNHPQAQFNLGVMYLHGTGVAKNETAAVEWFRKAAEQGFMKAQFTLGVMYAHGNGVAKDEAMAVKWYQKAAKQGHAAAQNSLGLRYDQGTGVAKDEAMAVKWYQKAAKQGHAVAQNNLGVCYFWGGDGVTRDFATAAYWSRKAAEQGQIGAQFMLGVHYTFGLGVTRDEAMAVDFLRKASEQDHPIAQYAQITLWIIQERVIIACGATVVGIHMLYMWIHILGMLFSFVRWVMDVLGMLSASVAKATWRDIGVVVSGFFVVWCDTVWFSWLWVLWVLFIWYGKRDRVTPTVAGKHQKKRC